MQGVVIWRGDCTVYCDCGESIRLGTSVFRSGEAVHCPKCDKRYRVEVHVFEQIVSGEQVVPQKQGLGQLKVGENDGRS
jgi:hypothetical protein